ncbi:MAG: LptF/LptG family permease [Bacteroidetes bacterium]|nr:LptF/LptG family permease [Bacteroidota bacterium]
MTRLMLRAFLGPFAVTLPVALFILDMQFLWVYADDLIGKGLDLWVVFKLMVYASARLVNLALPLAVLVASIMALGNLAERSELTAMKAAGMSFLRILRPLVLCMTLICSGALWFSNTGWPAANMRFRALLYSVTKQKPALNVREGVFYNGIEGFSIRVGTKHPDGNLDDILIHDHRDPQGQSVLVVHAEHGRMSQDRGDLLLELEDGVSYEEHQETLSHTKERVHPHIQSRFERQSLRIPLHSLDFSMANEDLFRRSYERMNLAELAHYSDSLQEGIVRERGDLVAYGKRNVQWLADTTGWYASAGATPQASPRTPWFSALPSVSRGRLFDKAREASRNHIRSLENAISNMEGKQLRQHRHDIEWHRKYILALGCMVLFLVGSSLGALVGRGGLGAPTLIALGVFLLYYSLSMLGEQLVKVGTLVPWFGMWLSTLTLLPLALALMWSTTHERRWLPQWGSK